MDEKLKPKEESGEPASSVPALPPKDSEKPSVSGAEKSWIEEAIEWLSIPKDLRHPKTIVEFCDKFAITRNQYYWEVEKADFQKRLLDRQISNVKGDAPEVLNKLVQNAKEGETRAIEIYVKYVLAIAEKVEHQGEVKGLTLNIVQANKNEGGNLGTNGKTN